MYVHKRCMIWCLKMERSPSGERDSRGAERRDKCVKKQGHSAWAAICVMRLKKPTLCTCPGKRWITSPKPCWCTGGFKHDLHVNWQIRADGFRCLQYRQAFLHKFMRVHVPAVNANHGAIHMNKRTHKLQVRVSEDEYAALLEAQAGSEYETVSAYVRAKVIPKR